MYPTISNYDVNFQVEVADTMAKTRNLIRIAEDSPDKAVLLGRRLETAWNLVGNVKIYAYNGFKNAQIKLLAIFRYKQGRREAER